MVDPSFFIIGAQKAGTTTVHEWLSQHPQICLPKIKETHFFSDDERYARGWGWYVSQFSEKKHSSSLIYGEIDPDYIYFPEAAERIKRMTSNPRFVIILREPLRRAYSHYLMTQRRGYEELLFADALQAEKKRIHEQGRFALDHYSYLARGLYSNQIKLFQQLFAESAFLFVKFESLFDPKTQVDEIRKIHDFIGAEFDARVINFTTKANEASRPRFKFLRDFIYRPSGVKKLLGKMISSSDLKLRLSIWLDRLNATPGQEKIEKEWDQNIPIAVHDCFFNDLLEAEKLTGLDLRSWIDYHRQSLEKKHG